MNKLPITLEKAKTVFGRVLPGRFNFVFTPPPREIGWQEPPIELLQVDKETPPTAWVSFVKLFQVFLEYKDTVIIRQTPGGKLFVFSYVFLSGFEYRIYADPRNAPDIYSLCCFGNPDQHNFCKCLAEMNKHIEQMGND